MTTNGGLKIDTLCAQLPLRAPVVYQIYDDEGLLYVGVSEYLKNRFRGHRRQPWWPTVRSVSAIECISRKAAERLESELIAKRKPRLNVSPGAGIYGRRA